MKKIILICLLCFLSVSCIKKQEYTLHYSSDNVGIITIKKDFFNKITITPKISKFDGNINSISIDNEICPLLPEIFLIKSGTKLITIEGNTTTETLSDGTWSKTVVDGNTTIEKYSNGDWKRTVVEGNTTTVTKSNGYWKKPAVEGNITTFYYANGFWSKKVINGKKTTKTDINWNPRKVITVIRGNTTIEIDSSGWWWRKTVVEGNTTTETSFFGSWSKTVDGNTTTVTSFSNYNGSWQKTVIDKQGHNIYIFEESWRNKSGWYGTP